MRNVGKVHSESICLQRKNVLRHWCASKQTYNSMNSIKPHSHTYTDRSLCRVLRDKINMLVRTASKASRQGRGGGGTRTHPCRSVSQTGPRGRLAACRLAVGQAAGDSMALRPTSLRLRFKLNRTFHHCKIENVDIYI